MEVCTVTVALWSVGNDFASDLIFASYVPAATPLMLGGLRGALPRDDRREGP